MNDELGHHRGLDDNFFSHFSYDSWTSKELQQLHPTFEGAISQLETNPNLEAAFAVFWKLLDPAGAPTVLGPDDIEKLFNNVEQEIKKGDPGFQFTQEVGEAFRKGLRQDSDKNVDRLEALGQRLRPTVVPDEPVSGVEAVMYAHVSAALATILETLDGTQTERFCEVVGGALALLQWPSTDDYWESAAFAFDLFISKKLVEVFLWSKLFQSHYLNNSYEKALECLFKASKVALEADSDLYDNECLGIDEWMSLNSGQEIRMQGGKLVEPGPAITTTGIGFHLVAFQVPAQKAVDAFDQLLSVSQASVNWEVIARWCSTIQEIWTEPTPSPTVRSKSLTFKGTARDFWLMGRGAALQKMSPDALVRVLEEGKMLESETRLRTYFFAEHWNHLPDKAQRALISADREYVHSHGRRSIIFDHLRHAVRAILAEQIWKPFQAHLRSQKNLQSLGNLATVFKDDEPDLAPMLRLLGDGEFQKYLRQHFDPTDIGNLETLERELWNLNNLANVESHEHRRTQSTFEQDVKNEYAKFLGIGQSGILQKLLALKPRR
jgi:hemerythrin-like domain-containing protein